MYEVVRIDDKGRILIPAKFRRKLSSRVVKIRMEGDRLTVEPLKDPLEILTSSVRKGTRDIKKEIEKLRRAAEKQLLTEMGESLTD